MEEECERGSGCGDRSELCESAGSGETKDRSRQEDRGLHFKIRAKWILKIDQESACVL